MDVITLYQLSTKEWLSRLNAITADKWTASTPCSEWDTRALVNHIVSEERWLPPLMQGATISEVGDKFDGDLLGENPIRNARDAAEQAASAVPAAVEERRIVHLSFGDTPVDEYVYQLAADHLIHAWDLAAAIGADRKLHPELVAEISDWFAGNEKLYRDFDLIGPSISLSDDSAQTKLLAAYGRAANWEAAA